MFPHQASVPVGPLSIWISVIIIFGILLNSSHGLQSNSTVSTPQPLSGVSQHTDRGSSTEPNPIKKSNTSTTNTTVPITLPPSYTVLDTFGDPCLLATFNITLTVCYRAHEQSGGKKVIAFRDINVPHGEDDISYSYSMCGDNSSSLVISWDNSTFSLNLTFVKHGLDQYGIPTNWSLNSIAFTYNANETSLFPGSVAAEDASLERRGLNLFNTRIGVTKECGRETEVRLGSEAMGSSITFQYVKLAAFNLTSNQFPNETERCRTARPHSIKDEDIMVPLIIACALSGVIISVVIAYAISRKVQETRDQTQYKPMP